MNTERIQTNHIISDNEKRAFIAIASAFDWLYKPIIQTAKPYLSAVQSLVDVGCADGTLTRKLKAMFPDINYFGIDIDPFFIQKAQESDAYNSYSVGDVDDLSEEADIVASNLSLHHFLDPKRAIENMYKISRKVVIISDQIRPETEEELERRLDQREAFLKRKLGDKYQVPFYDRNNERKSILESYSRREIEDILRDSPLLQTIRFLDNDYYERFTVEILK